MSAPDLSKLHIDRSAAAPRRWLNKWTIGAAVVVAIASALVGGLVGLGLASFLQVFTVTTMNWQSFSQRAA